MYRRSVLIAAFIVSFGLRAVFAGDDRNSVPSVLRSATVYRVGAELTHTASAALRQGTNEVWIEDISNNIDPASIRVNCSGNVTIMSVSFSTEFLKPEVVAPAVRRLQDSIEALKSELSKNEIRMKSDADLLDLLNANKSMAGTQTGVSVAELMKMVEYYRTKGGELRADMNLCQEKAARWKIQIDKLEKQVEEEEKKNSKTSGRILLQLLSPVAVTSNLTISYMTPLAYWTPFYDLRADNAADPLRIIYKARLVQTSGIDWKQVRLSLSTTAPAQQANAPVLKTWFLRFVNPVADMEYRLKDGAMNTLTGKLAGRAAGLDVNQAPALQEVVVTALGVEGGNGERRQQEPIFIVNGKEMSYAEFSRIDPRAIKSVDKLSASKAANIYGSRAGGGATIVTLKDELSDYVATSENQADLTFDIDIPYDIPGNGKEQGIVLKEYKTPCIYQYYSVPKLDKDAYLLGQVPGWEKLNLLPGEANIILEGTWAGKTWIDPASTLDTLSLTLGRDKRVVVKREKVSDFSSVKFMGSNKKQVFTWEITVRNNRKEKIRMLLKDQQPISSTKDIEAELLEGSGASVNPETGVLTWQVELAPGESRKYRVSYSVKYPKDRVLNL